MNYNCGLCFKKLDDLAFDLRSSKSKHSGIHLITLIENILENVECLQNITRVCKECNNLLLELDIVRCRFLEIQNTIKQYFEKRQEFSAYSVESQTNENVKSNEQDQISDFELFENITENHSNKDKYINDTFNYSSSKIIDYKGIAIKREEEKPQKNKLNKQNPQFTCHCSKIFLSSKDLKKHLRSHDNEIPYVCELCGQSYKKKASFDTHQRMHEGATPFICIYCNKSFTQKIALIRHVPIHTGEKPHQCEECGKRFTHHTSFNAHKLIHTGEKPFKCQHCNKTFRSSSHLARHKRVHTGEKKFGCSVCGKHFAEKYNLIVHQKIHSNKDSILENKGRHCCQICGERFERPKKLEEHKVKIHLSVKMEPLTQMYND